MADETAKTEDVKVEDTEALNAAIAEGEEATKDEIPQEITDANKVFDEKLDSDDDSAIEDTSGTEEKPAEEAEEKNADEKAADTKPTGEEKAVEQTAQEKEIEQAADDIAKGIEAEAGKSEEDKQAEADAKAKADAEKKTETEEKPYDCGLPTDGDEDYDEDLVKAINKQGQETQDANKALKTENANLQNMVTQQNRQRSADWLDSKINALGEDFHETLGVGEYEDLEVGSDQESNRIKLGNRIGVLVKAYQDRNMQVPSRNKLFDKAVSYLFKKEINKSKTDADTVKKAGDRAGQKLGPGSRKASALSEASSLQQDNAAFDKKLDED